MRSWEFDLPFPPSVNGYWRAYSGRQILSKRGRQYKEKVIKYFEQIGFLDEGISSRLKVDIAFYPQSKRVYDLDNYFKAVLDSITTAGFWGDDSQIDQLSMKREHKIKGGKLVMRVQELEDKQ